MKVMVVGRSNIFSSSPGGKGFWLWIHRILEFSVDDAVVLLLVLLVAVA